jgi:benzoate-CoA ligase family protein
MDETFYDIPTRFNMADYFLYDRLREGLGERVAIQTRKTEWTYARTAAESDRFGNALRKLGVLPEERVLISLPDVPEFVAGIFGTLRIGGVVAMVNPLLPADDLSYYLEYTRCRVLFCDSDVAKKLAGLVEDHALLNGVIVLGRDVPRGPKFHAYADIVGNASTNLDPFATTKDDPAYWLFTSGSTGRPKAAMHLHHDFPWNCERYAKRVLGIRKDDVTLSVPRLYFGYATGTNVFFPFSVGATTCLFPEKPTPDVLFENIERFKPTILTSVPTSINQMVSHPEAKQRDVSSLRMVLSAGEALPPELLQRWTESFGVEILDGIGSAETFHIYISNAPGDVTPGSLGRLVPGYEAKVVGPEGDEVGSDEIGTLWVKGDSAAVGYWQAHEKSKETFRGDWVRTADLFRRDAQGRFWYSGRADDILKVGGMFVSPLEIEDRLLQHEAVAECVVVPYEDEGLQKPLALVVPAQGVDGDEGLAVELARFAKEGLAAYKFPRRVRFLEALPRNDRGKVERTRLRDQVARDGVGDAFDTGLASRSGATPQTTAGGS